VDGVSNPTELFEHNRPEILESVSPRFQMLTDDIAKAIAFMVTRPRRGSVHKLWFGPTEQIS
jgi:NADP-dependent 3-hydroxy acid dehydrogenase YdfG